MRRESSHLRLKKFPTEIKYISGPTISRLFATMQRKNYNKYVANKSLKFILILTNLMQ